jgi:hypothetical protein
MAQARRTSLVRMYASVTNFDEPHTFFSSIVRFIEWSHHFVETSFLSFSVFFCAFFLSGDEPEVDPGSGKLDEIIRVKWE